VAYLLLTSTYPNLTNAFHDAVYLLPSYTLLFLLPTSFCRLLPFSPPATGPSSSQVIVGGLVFLELSMPLIAAGLFDHVPDSSSSGRILTHLQAKRKRAEERIVLLAAILESELTISYDACVGRQLTKFNGQAVTHLKALAAAVTNASAAPFLKFEFDEWVAVLETAASKKAEADVLRAHDISSWCSADVDPTGDSVLLGCITAFSLRPNKTGLPALS